MKRSILPFVPHAVIAIAYATWALGNCDHDTMWTWVAIGHGFAPLWAGLIAIPREPWRAYLACVGTIIAGHVAGVLTTIPWLPIGALLWWATLIAIYALLSAIGFSVVVQVRRARR